jgi:hypothetical protein
MFDLLLLLLECVDRQTIVMGVRCRMVPGHIWLACKSVMKSYAESIPYPISCKSEGLGISDSLSYIEIERLHAHTIFHPIPCHLGPVWLLQSFPKFET